MNIIGLLGWGLPIIVLFVGWVIVSIAFRTVVPTNMVHIVQSRGNTVSYGTDQSGKNVYYNWPSWFPVIGVTRIVLPINNFSINLTGYEGYDKERVPFVVHVTAFFRIADAVLASQRVADFEKLKVELQQIVQGAARRVLAAHDIHEIMVDRSKFGQMFTDEVANDLTNWGVVTVKNMELMDIHDSQGSKVIANIMAMKASQIEMESRKKVAENDQLAQTAEIEAQRAVDISKQEAAQVVGLRTAEVKQTVGIADEKALQEIKAQAKVTKEREMDVIKVEQVNQASITKEAAIVAAEQDKETTILVASGQLEAKKLEAEGIKVEGEAKGKAEQAILLAPVNAQITLAKEIGSNVGYQGYLVALEGVKAYIAVGTEQAKALSHADVKVIANTGNATQGATSAMGLFTPQGGMNLGAMLEAVSQTPQGKQMLDAVKGLMSSRSTTTPANTQQPEDSKQSGAEEATA